MQKSRIEKQGKNENKEEKSSGSVVVTIFKLIIIFILVFILTVMCMFWNELRNSEGDATRAAVEVLRNVADVTVEEDPIYVLLLGYSTDQGLTLTDTIMLLGYNPQTQKAFMVSIPRDTFVGTSLLKATSYDKINALYSNDGAEDTIEAVEEITGVDIDYYVAVNTDVVIEIVDIIGGVEFDVPIDMDYDDPTQDLHIHLEAGLQLIDGEAAEGLLRFRHNNDGTTYDTEYGDNDYGRMRTQREFIAAAIEQCLEVNDLSTMKEIVTTVFDNLETDCSLTTILSYLVYIYDFDMDDLSTAQIPGESVLANSLWVFQYDEDETEELMAEILEDFNSDGSEDETDENIISDNTNSNETNSVSNNSTNSVNSTN